MKIVLGGGCTEKEMTETGNVVHFPLLLNAKAFGFCVHIRT